MLHKLTIPVKARIIISLAGAFILLAFADQRQDDTICRSVVVNMKNAYDNHFIDKSDVFAMLNKGTTTLIGARISAINLRQLETTLEHNQYILDAQLYSTIKGTLTVKIQLRKPIARLVSNKQPDMYISKDGKLLSLSDKFTARTMLISGYLAEQLIKLENIKQNGYGQQLMKIIQYINNSHFWKAQVAQLHVDRKNNLTIYPQVTDQKVEFGEMNDIDRKFKKLMIFYKRILPHKGWTKYDEVNVQYEGQIVAR